MSYAIVRNEKLTRAEINGKGTHNDRKAKNHTNKDIVPTDDKITVTIFIMLLSPCLCLDKLLE